MCNGSVYLGTGCLACEQCCRQLFGLALKFVDPDPCEYDHHGLCQAHNLDQAPCPQEIVKICLAKNPRLVDLSIDPSIDPPPDQLTDQQFDCHTIAQALRDNSDHICFERDGDTILELDEIIECIKDQVLIIKVKSISPVVID